MGAFNTIKGKAMCPSCGYPTELEAQFKYGDTWQQSYRIGDKIRWGGNDIGTPGRKHVLVEAIGGPCSYCQTDGLDFDVVIKNDEIVGIEPVRGGRVAAGPEGFVVVDAL